MSLQVEAFLPLRLRVGTEEGLLELVAELPVEVVLRDGEQQLGAAVGVLRGVAHVLAAVVHVRRHGVQIRIALDQLLTFPLEEARGDRTAIGVWRSPAGR